MTETAALTYQQRHAIRLLALGHTQAAVALRVGCHTRTLRRWKETLPHYARALEEAISELRDPTAEDVLRELLYSADEKVRLAAASALLKARAVIPGMDDEDGKPMFIDINPLAVPPDPDAPPPPPPEREPERPPSHAIRLGDDARRPEEGPIIYPERLTEREALEAASVRGLERRMGSSTPD
jgi:transposase-like protein